MTPIIGIIHVHSKLSHDGTHTLDEIALMARRRGYSFVGVTEHAEAFDAGTMGRLIGECTRLSGAGLLMIPGLEFACSKDLHLLGVGITHVEHAGDPIATARFIRAQGGVAILAHPARGGYRVPAGLECHLDGIEVWNARDDGPFAPNDRAISLWQDLRPTSRSLVAFGGQDLHGLQPRWHVKITIPDVMPREALIFDALREGHFDISNPWMRLRARAYPGTAEFASIAVAHRTYLRARAAGRSLRDRWRGVRRKSSPGRADRRHLPAEPAAAVRPDGR